jgi:hypothetical protein
VQDKWDLEENQIYIVYSDQEDPLQYTRAFTRKRFLEWIALTLGKKYVHINSRSYDMFIRTKNPHLVIFLDDSQDSKDALQKFTANYESYFETVEGAICEESNPGCRDFILRVGESKFNEMERPFLVMMSTSAITPDELIYFYPQSQPITKKNLKQFVDDFRNNKITYSSFSEPDPVALPAKEVHTVTQGTMRNFFLSNYNRDMVVLFYDSRMCQQPCFQKSAVKGYCHPNQAKAGQFSGKCEALKERFKVMVGHLREHSDPDGEMIRYGMFDLGKNSHYYYQIGKAVPFIRMYKMGKYNNFVDHVIPEDNDTFENDIIHFLMDTSTEDLKLHEIEEDM